MKSRADVAIENFRNGFNCAQAVFSAYAAEFGISETDALRIACGFGAGMGRLQGVCGTVSGACMLIGCKYGKVRKDDDAARETTYRLVREFAGRFESLNEHLDCRDLLGCDLNSPEGHAEFLKDKLRATRCEKYVRDSCRLVEELLFDSK